jgi:hypothetical protein
MQIETRFWVIGGEFTDCRFHSVIGGTEAVFGPFDSYDQALSKWRQCADETKCRAQVRYSIAEEGVPTQQH